MNELAKKAVPIISVAELEKMHTGSLLTRLQKLRELEEDPASSTWLEEEISQFDDMILFKSSNEWKMAYRDLKSVLNTREHVPRGRNKK